MPGRVVTWLSPGAARTAMQFSRFLPRPRTPNWPVAFGGHYAGVDTISQFFEACERNNASSTRILLTACDSGQARAGSPRTSREKRSACNWYWLTTGKVNTRVGSPPMRCRRPTQHDSRRRGMREGKSRRANPAAQNAQLLMRAASVGPAWWIP